MIQAQRPGAPTFAALAIDIDRFKEVNDAARHVVRRLRAAHRGAPARPRAQARRHARAHGRRPVRRHRAARRARDGRRGVRRIAARADGRADQLRRSRSGAHGVDRRRAVRPRRCTPKAPTSSPTRKSRSPTPRRPAATAPRSSRGACAPRRSNRLSLADDLRHALDRGEIAVLFQPIVRLEDRTVAGFEALPRWRHPRLGLLGPDDFFSLAEVERRPRRHRRLRHRNDRARTRGVAEGARSDAADLRQHQRLVAPDARPRPARATCEPRSTAITSCAAR